MTDWSVSRESDHFQAMLRAYRERIGLQPKSIRVLAGLKNAQRAQNGRTSPWREKK